MLLNIRFTVLAGTLAGLLVTMLSLSLPANAERKAVADPRVDYGNGFDITRLVGSNGADRIDIRATVPNLGAFGPPKRVRTFVLGIEATGQPVQAAAVIRWKRDGSKSATFMALYPESAPERVDCPSLRWSLKPAKGLVTASFPQTCYAAAMGYDVNRQSKIRASVNWPGFSGDQALTRPLRRG